ncbi:sphingomyelin phosphodiesterase 2 [Athene cunicularia]|nr:sphingomyelin phosphodiesterase 2 [Athene cunicularia]
MVPTSGVPGGFLTLEGLVCWEKLGEGTQNYFRRLLWASTQLPTPRGGSQGGHELEGLGGFARSRAVLTWGSWLLCPRSPSRQLHAEYCREKDAYLPHRLVQAWELAQFIRHTSKAADVVLLGGDLNMHPEDVGIRLLRGWTGLRDAFAEAAHFEGCEDGCTLIPNNCFTVKSELLPFPLGIRIDYILYKAVSSFTVKCEELKTTTGPAPGMDIPFSDHEAVMATLHIQRQGRSAGATLGTAEPTLVDVVTEARTEVGVGLRAARQQRYSTGRMAVLALLLLLLQALAVLGALAGLAAGQPFPKLSFSLLAFLAIGVLLLATGLHLFHTMEVKMLQGTEEQMRMALRALQERPSDG